MMAHPLAHIARAVNLPSCPFGFGFPPKPHPQYSSRGPRLAINCFHTYTPTLHFCSSSIFYPYSFSSFFYIPFCPSHPFFLIIFPKFSPSFSPFSLPHSFHQLPSKMSFPQSPRLIHFKKKNFCKIYCKRYLSSKTYSNCLKTICPFPGQKIEQQQHHSLLRFISFIIYFFGAWSHSLRASLTLACPL